MKIKFNLRAVVIVGLLVALALLPLYSGLSGDRFALTLFEAEKVP